MRVAIHQPQYLPWMGLLEKWRAVDLLIILDTVQYERGGWQNRCRIRTPHGDRWLTVPVRRHSGPALDEILIADDAWRRIHRKTLAWAYPRLPVNEWDLFAQPWLRLAALTVASMTLLGRTYAKITTPMLLASDLPIPETENATGRLVSLCREVGARRYLSGVGGRAYVDEDQFRAAGIAVDYQDGHWPPYTALDAFFGGS